MNSLLFKTIKLFAAILIFSASFFSLHVDKVEAAPCSALTWTTTGTQTATVTGAATTQYMGAFKATCNGASSSVTVSSIGVFVSGTGTTAAEIANLKIWTDTTTSCTTTSGFATQPTGGTIASPIIGKNTFSLSGTNAAVSGSTGFRCFYVTVDTTTSAVDAHTLEVSISASGDISPTPSGSFPLTVAGTTTFADKKTITGTVYSDEGTTAVTCQTTTKLAIGTTLWGSVASCAGNVYTFSNVTGVIPGTTLVIFNDTATAADRFSIVTRADNNTSTLTLNAYKGRLIVRSDSGSNITNADLDNYCGSGCTGNSANIQYTNSAGALTVTSGTKLLVWTADTFAPGNNVTTDSLEVMGTYSGNTETLTLAGVGTSTTCTAASGTVVPLCINGGTFTTPTNVSVTGAGTTTLLSAATTFNNLTINNASAAVTSGANLTINGNLTITAGSLQLGASNLTVTGTSSITGTLADNSATGTNLFTGAVTINSGGIWNVTAAQAFEFRGGLTNNSISGFTSGSGTYSFTTNAQTVSGSQAFTITNISNTITASTGLTFSGAQPTVGTLTQGSSAMLTFSGTVPTITTLDATTNSFDTVQYTSSGAQTVVPTSYYELTINKSAGTATVGGAGFDVWDIFTLTAGTFDANNNNVSMAFFSSSNSNTRAITMGTGVWTVYGSGTVWDTTITTGLTVTANTSTIKLTNNSSGIKTFSGGGKTYNNIWFAPATGTGSFEVRGSNTFADFKDDGSVAHSILFAAGATQTMSSFTVSGHSGQLITINSSNGSGSTSTLTHTLTLTGSGTVSSDYLNIQHSVVTGGSGWYAGTNSTNNNSVATAGSGWLFSSPACTSTGSGNWNTVGTWNCGHVPGAGESPTIATGHTVALDTNTASLGTVTVNGTLSMPSSNTLTATSLAIASGGTLNAGASSSWQNYRTITIDHTKVPNTDQTNFPMLVSGVYTYLKTTGNSGSVQNASGYDIAFFSDSSLSTPLKFDREKWDGTTGELVAWVKVPTLSHTVDTTIYMAYGNSTISTDQADPTNVWGSYEAVWHLSESGSTVADSTASGVNGTKTDATKVYQATGKIGYAQHFQDSGAGRTEVVTNTNINQAHTAATVSAWVNIASLPHDMEIFRNDNGNGNTGFGLWVSSGGGGNLGSYVYIGGAQIATSTSTLTVGTWAQVAMRYNGSSEDIYINGVKNGTPVTVSGTIGAGNTAVTLGNYGPTQGVVGYFDGLIDEERVSPSALSDDWILTDYNNENSPSTFYSVGAQQAPSVAPTIVLTGTGSSVLTNSGTFTAGNSTVKFEGDGAVTIPAVSYNNLTLDPTITAGRTYTLNATTVAGNLAVNPTAASALALTVNMGANLVVTGDTTIQATSSATAALDTRAASVDYNLTTAHMTVATGATLDATSSASVITLSGTSGTLFTVGGTFNPGSSTVTVSGAGTTTLLSGTPTFNNLTINNASAVVTLAAMTVSGTFTLTQGSVNANNNNISIANFSSSNTNTRAITMGSGTWSLTGTGTVWDTSTITGLTITQGTSTIKITDTSSSTKIFKGGGKTYNNIWYAPGTGTGSFETAGGNTFNDFKDDGTIAHTLLFTAGTTTTVTTFTVSGHSAQLITITSGDGAGNTSTSTHTLSTSATLISSDYLNIQHSIATPANVWYAGANSTNNQGVTSTGSGWTFTVPPVDGTPYGGTAWSVPGTIQFEDYNNGGEGVAYHDTEAANQGGQYRPSEGVDIELATGDTSGTYNLGWVYSTEWTKYTINVATPGTYTLSVRVGSLQAGSLPVYLDGSLLTTITTPNTGGNQVWQTATSSSFSLSIGTHVLKYMYDNNNTNFNYMNFNLIAAAGCVSNGTGNWNTAGTWGCGHVPAASDNVTIATGHTVTMDVGSNTLGTITVNGTLNSSGFALSGTSLSIGSSGAVSAGASTITLSGTTGPLISSAGGTFTPGTSTVVLSGNGTAKINSGVTTLNNLNLTGTGTKYIGAATTLNGSLTIGSTSTFGAGNNLTVSGSVTNSGTYLGDGWQYYKKITIDHTKVPNTDQTNFPVVINTTDLNLKSIANGGHVVSDSGYDIGFYSDQAFTTKMKWEVETYNPTTGQFVAWVKVPTLSHTTDTVIYLAYGNVGVVTDQSDKVNVWDANYKAVWHLDESISGNSQTLANSTSFSENLTTNSSTTYSGVQSTGPVGYGISLSKTTNDYLSFPQVTLSGDWTVEGWAKLSATPDNMSGLFGNGTTGGGLIYNTNWFGSAYRAWNGTTDDIVATTTIASGAWHHYVITRSGTAMALYLDGNSDKTSVNGKNAIFQDLGVNADGSTTNSILYDEVRISTSQRSADWVKTEYNDQNSPSTFYTVGSETSLTPVSASTFSLAGSWTNTGTYNASGATIKMTDNSSNPTFAGGGTTYTTLWLSPGTGTGTFTISGNNTLNTFIDDGTGTHTIKFTAGSAQTIGTWSVSGTSGHLISLDSTTTGTYSLIKQGSQARGDYLNIQHSIATPSGNWYAGDNSINNQGVISSGTGWVFTTVTKYHGGGGGAAGGESVGTGTNQTGGGTGGGSGNAGGETTGTGQVKTGGGTGGGGGDSGSNFNIRFLAFIFGAFPLFGIAGFTRSHHK